MFGGTVAWGNALGYKEGEGAGTQGDMADSPEHFKRHHIRTQEPLRGLQISRMASGGKGSFVRGKTKTPGPFGNSRGYQKQDDRDLESVVHEGVARCGTLASSGSNLTILSAIFAESGASISVGDGILVSRRGIVNGARCLKNQRETRAGISIREGPKGAYNT